MTTAGGPENKIKCVLFCKFDSHTGPVISFQVPDGYVQPDDFHGIQNYLIPKEELQQKLITVKSFNRKILGCPIYIQGEEYERNYFIFNVCFIFDENVNTSSYEKVLKKLAHYFVTLEKESHYLSNTEHSGGAPPVKEVLDQVLHKLNTAGSCSIPIDEANTIHLKLVPCYRVPPIVRDHDVPILTFKPEEYHSNQWDLATQQVLPYIDGFKHTMHIALESNFDVRHIRAIIQNLLYYELVQIIPIFQFSNIYVITSDIQILYTSHDLQNRCMQAVALSSKCLPKFEDILRLYSCFTHGTMTTVKQVCLRHKPKKLSVDVRKLIQFGVVNHLIRRIHKYPVRVKSTSESSGGASSAHLKLCDGTHSYDEICCALGISYEELDARIEEDSSIQICWK